MDQVRKILAWLKQYHFWVLSLLIVFIGLFCWWSAASALKKQYAENETKVKGAFSTVAQVKGDTFHPNENITKQQTEEIEKLAAQVAEIWQKLYERQSENVLKWPAVLNDRFHKTVNKLRFGAEIPDDLREHYQNYITRHFEKLPEKIGARAIDESVASGMGGFSRMGGEMGPTGGMMSATGEMEDDGNYLCAWEPADQALVRAELEFPQTPSSLRVWCTQENLWVYHTLLDVIKNTNEAANATRRSNAAVRVIHSLQVGQPAAKGSRTPDRIYKLPSAAATAEGMPGEEFPGGPPMEGGLTGVGPEGMEFASGLADGGTGELTEAEEAQRLLSGRYLGEDGKPIDAAAAGGGDPSVPADPSIPAPAVDMSVYGKEFKRLPVRMVLEMDQRYLPRLIAECAIRPLQIEVQEVRINAPDLLTGQGGMAGYGGGFSEGGGFGGGNANLIPDLTGIQDFNPHPEIVTVAVQGVIYIFNKPDLELLKPTASEDASIALAP